MSGRGRGGKFSKPKRGGGKHFSRNLRPLNADGEVESMWADRKENLDEDEDSDEDEDDEVTDESEAGDISTASPMNDANMTREQRKEVARARKAAAIAKQNRKTAEPGDLPSSEDDEGAEEEDNMPANPNHTVKAAKQASVAAEPSENVRRNIKRADDMSNLSRREREALQAQQAKERYAKLHAEGKTDEARADLARLKLVKEKREAEAARKKAEQEEREEHERSKRDQIEREERMRERAKSRKDRGGKGKKAGPV